MTQAGIEGTPNWVQTMDKYLTHTSNPNEWNKSMADMPASTTTERKRKSKRTHFPNVKRSKSGDSLTRPSDKAMLFKGHYSGTSSLASKVITTSEKEKRKKSKRLGLCLILLTVAFVVAALLGLLVYYLLTEYRTENEQGNDVKQSLGSGVTIRILNETYDASMSNRSSEKYRFISGSVCQAMDAYFMSSNLSKYYNGCDVTEIRNVAEVPDCQCMWSSDGSLIVTFKLIFRGNLNKDTLRWSVYDIIESSSSKHYAGSLVYVAIKYFLVDIRANWFGHYDGVEAKLTIPVSNMNHSDTLMNTLSDEFQRHNLHICNYVTRLLTDKTISAFAGRYHNCGVIGFRSGNVSLLVQFKDREWRSVQKMLVYVLMAGARNGTIHFQMIEPLTVTSLNWDFTINPINITGPSTSMESTRPPDLVYTYDVLPTFNLTFTPELHDPQSDQFINVTTEFCRELKKLFDMSVHGHRFHSCKVHTFRNDPPSVVVSVGYTGGVWSGMGGSIQWVIHRHAPRMYLPGENGNLIEVGVVGPVYIVLGKVTANGLELRTNLRALNLTYTSDLKDQTTPGFRRHAHLFCQDMRNFYKRSSLRDRFFDCGVDQFTNNPVRVHFYIVFQGVDLGGLGSSMAAVIRQFGQPVYYLQYLTYRVGDLLVLPQDIPPVQWVHPTNITTLTTSSLYSSVTSPEATIAPSVTHATTTLTRYGLSLTLYYEVYNLTFTDDLRHPESAGFRRHKHAVCDDLWRWYMSRDSPFIDIYRGCDVTSFNLSPTGVTFNLLFDTAVQENFPRNVRTFLEYTAPKLYVPGMNLLDVGHLLLVMDRFRIHVFTTTVPSRTLEPPSATSVPLLATSFSMASTTTPPATTMTAAATTSGLAKYGIVLVLYYEVYNLTFTDELRNPETAMFKWHKKTVCDDLQRWYLDKDSLFAAIYRSCDVTSFNPYPTGVTFNLVFDTALQENFPRNVRTYLEYKAPKVYIPGFNLLDVGHLPLIMDRFRIEVATTVIYSPSSELASATVLSILTTPFIMSSATAFPDPVTPTRPGAYNYVLSLEFGLADFTFTPDLYDKNSARFKWLSDRFCKDIHSYYTRSELKDVYDTCTIDGFSQRVLEEYPEKIYFSLEFSSPMFPEVRAKVIDTLFEEPPRVPVSGFQTLHIGDLFLIIDAHVSVSSSVPASDRYFTPTTAAVDDFSPTLTKEISPSTVLPYTTTTMSTRTTVTTTRVTTTFTTAPKTTKTTTHSSTTPKTTRTSKSKSPSTTTALTTTAKSTTTTQSTTASTTKPTTTTQSTTASTTKPTTTTQSTTASTTKTTTTTQSTTASTTKPTTTTQSTTASTTKPTTTTQSTTASTTKPTTTAQSTTASTTKPSTATTTTMKQTTTTSTTVTTTTTSTPTTTTTKRITTTTKPTTRTTKQTTTSVKRSTVTTRRPTTTAPTTRTTTMSTKSTEATFLIRMSFETKNLTFTEDLNNRSSPTFKYIEEKFCADIDKIMDDHRHMFPPYLGCQIDIFGGSPLRVNFSLQFRELQGTNKTAVKNLVVGMLIENAIRKEYHGVFSLLVGNLLIAVDSISVEPIPLPTASHIYDAIGYNYTFYLDPRNYSDQLLDKDSQAFKETAYRFCKDVNKIFENSGVRAVRKRYHGCVVDEFGPNREVKFRVVLKETDSVRPSTMFNIFAYHDQVNNGGIFNLRLGDLFLAVDLEPPYSLLRLDSFITHPYPFATTTPKVLYTVMTISLDVFKPGWSEDLSVTTSAGYRLLAEAFCADLSSWVSTWNRDYIKCANVKFNKEPFKIVADLTFRGEQSSSLQEDLNTIILETAKRIPVDNLYALEIGKMLIYDKSLVQSQKTISAGNSTASAVVSKASTASTTTTPRTTTPLQPCLGTANLGYVPHPSKCDEFFQCIDGVAYPIPCREGHVFQGSTCIPVPPGFICQR